MSKPIFASTDPRGFRVYLCEDRWQHALDRHPDMAGHEETVKATVEAPDEILDNEPLGDGMPVRTAQERYVRHDGALNTQVVVVAKVLPPGATLHGVGTVEPNSRLVVTAHTSYDAKGRKIWPKVVVHPPRRK